MLIPDLLNILFDQADYLTLVGLGSLRKRTTTYASKYSLLAYYDIFDKTSIKNIEYVCARDNIKMIKQMVDVIKTVEMMCARCNVKLQLNREIDIMFVHSVTHDHIETVKYLLDNGANIDFGMGIYIFSEKTSVLLFCVHRGKLSLVKYLMSVGAHVNWNKAITLGAEGGHFEIVKYLVKQWNSHCIGQYPINEHLVGTCFQRGYTKVAKYLVGIGAKIQNDGRFVIWCAERGDLEAIEYLIGIGIGIGIETDLQHALVRAARMGHLHVVKYLVSIGTLIPIYTAVVSNHGPVTLLAECEGYADVVAYLREQNA